MGVGSGEDPQVAQIVCAGAIQGDGTVRKERGCVVARTGAGVYTVTINPVAVDGQTVTQQGNLSGGIAAAQFIHEIQAIGGGAERFASVANTSDTVKTITIEDSAPVPVNTDFEFVFKRTALG